MNWEAVGAIGETVGAVGVIITLIYLATQLRQNTLALRVASIDSTTKVGNDIRTSLLSDPELTEIYIRALADPDSLTEIERERFRLMMTNALWALCNAYMQSHLGGGDSWAAQKYIVGRLMSSPGAGWYWANYREEFDPDFRNQVDSHVRKSS